MTRNHNKDFSFPSPQGISPSSMELLQGTYGCPLKYKFQKVDKIELPPKRIMQCGTLFDELCNGGYPAATAWGKHIILGDIDIVAARYESYRHHINYDTDWLQVPVWMDITPSDIVFLPEDSQKVRRYLFGYVDRIETEECEESCRGCDGKRQCEGIGTIPTKIIDHKLSEKPWPVKQRKDGTFSSSKMKETQGKAYINCVNAMYGTNLKEMEFHVVNMLTPEIQIITYRPQAKSLKALDKLALDAISLRESGYFEPEPEEHKCKYCDYTAQCEAYVSQIL